ncbi:MAG: DUF2185 domain-containing protein [Sphingobacteriales bacterium]|nr:MAG: DUF2185 domain-containing protein [Sphingobacteriales bacterium]
MSAKNFKIKAVDLVELVPPMGGCLATDKITIDGMTVGYMYRETPNHELDSGWRFFSGTEDQDYIDDLTNTLVYSINTIANYDPAIIAYLDLPFGTELERIENSNQFDIIPG